MRQDAPHDKDEGCEARTPLEHEKAGHLGLCRRNEEITVSALEDVHEERLDSVALDLCAESEDGGPGASR